MLQIFRNLSNRNITTSTTPKEKYFTKLHRALLLGTLSTGGLYLAIYKPDSISASVRFLRTVKIGLSISLDYFFTMKRLRPELPENKILLSHLHKKSAEKILNGCLVNGGTYIKIGQGLVSLSHILPKEYIEVLVQLQDKCFTRPPSEVVDLFLQDFGKAPEQIFEQFNYKPIAAASLAQVFTAKSKDGEELAVKVQYIDLQKRFISDVATIHFLLKLAGLMHPSYDFSWVVREVLDTLKEELNFQHEGRNAERCSQDLKHLKYIHVPKIHWDKSNTRVLTMEYVHGVKINEKEELLKQGFSLADIDYKMINAFGYQIFQTGFVHADPHPGNILVRKNKKETQLVLLDHGLYQTISDKDRKSLSNFWMALVLQNHKDMQKYSNALGVTGNSKMKLLQLTSPPHAFIHFASNKIGPIMNADYAMLAEVLTQRPLRSVGFQLKTKLTEEDMQRITQFVQTRFDLIMETLKTMPRSMLLVVRNLNTVRAITHDHGDPIDRYTVLARTATAALHSDGRFFSNIKRLYIMMLFEYRLWKNWMSVNLLRCELAILYYLGRSPDAKKIISKLA